MALDAAVGLGPEAVDYDKLNHWRASGGTLVHRAFGAVVAIVGMMAWAAAAEPAPPLSAAQQALFATPHLANVTRPEALEYRFVQLGPGGFTDRVTVTIAGLHRDGSKDLRFEFLTGERHVDYPGIAHFAGNPVLMLFLERDVRQMHDQTGLAAAYFRERLRQSFLSEAALEEGTATVGGRPVPARTIVVRPYATDPRFRHVPVITGKTYTFVVSPDVPGGIASLRADAPADPSVGAPALGSTLTFAATHP